MSTSVTVGPGQAANNVVLHLLPAGNVSGRVTGDNGEPLVGVEVSLIRATYSIGGRKSMSQMGSAPTNDRGEYRLFWMTPGQYYLAVNPSSRNMGGFGPNMPSAANNKHPRTFYPGTTDISGGTEIEILPGGELNGIDFRLASQPVYRIRGRVVDSATGQFPQSANISIIPREQMIGGISSSGAPYNPADGTFELRDILAGSYWIRAQMPFINRPQVAPGGRPPSPPSAVAAVDVAGSDVDNVVLTVLPPMSIQGRVRIEGQASLTGAMTVSLQPAAGGGMMVGPFPTPAQVQPDGTFQIENVGPGEYQVAVPGMGPTPAGLNAGQALYVKEARLGSINVLTEPVTIAGPVSGDLQIVLAGNAGQIRGTVTDERQQPASRIQVVFIPVRRERRDLYKMGMTEASGQFTLQGVPPGSYKAFAIDPAEMTSFFDPAVMQKFEPRGQAVNVAESSNLTVDLRVIR